MTKNRNIVVVMVVAAIMALLVLLAQLPEKQGRAIQLVKLDHLSVREASVKLGISEADIKVSIHRGLKKLMSVVSKEKSS